MLPTSHGTPIQVAPGFNRAADGPLADAFTAFISAAGRLERSYGQLHEEVAQLRIQLEERNRALASSLEENERMRVLHREILDALPCGVAVVEAERENVVLLNPEAKRLMGISGEEKPRWAALPSSIRSMIDSGPTQTWRQGDEQLIAVRGLEAERWLRIRCTSIGSTNVRPGKSSPLPFPTLILTVRDTTSQKQADEQREASRHMVALAEMATLLAHEIRNPLGSLELFASLLATDAGLTDDSKKWVQHLQAGVRSLAATVNNVLRFHTPGSAALVVAMLRDILVNGVEFVRPLAEQAGVDLVFDETLGETEIMCDPGGLQQVLLNLAHNALRHTPAGGTLRVCASIDSRANGRFAVIEVSDTGSGIGPKDLPRIFEAGFSTNRQSTGLGLAVCARIMAQHSGAITATSRLGEGSTFHLELPTL
ncbi:MAG: ATP-binding protein [Terriglobales bacterium]